MMNEVAGNETDLFLEGTLNKRLKDLSEWKLLLNGRFHLLKDHAPPLPLFTKCRIRVIGKDGLKDY